MNPAPSCLVTSAAAISCEPHTRPRQRMPALPATAQPGKSLMDSLLRSTARSR
jgi:hypothetical protein